MNLKLVSYISYLLVITLRVFLLNEATVFDRLD